MKRKELLVVLCVIVLVCFGSGYWVAKTSVTPISVVASGCVVETYFSKEGNTEDAVLKFINSSQTYLYFAVYTINRDSLVEALVEAKRRKVKVVGVIDRTQYKAVPAMALAVDKLIIAGIPIDFDNHQGIMHLKVALNENATLSGSFNWTNPAVEKNDEVVYIMRNCDAIKDKHQKMLEEMVERFPSVTAQK